MGSPTITKVLINHLLLLLTFQGNFSFGGTGPAAILIKPVAWYDSQNSNSINVLTSDRLISLSQHGLGSETKEIVFNNDGDPSESKITYVGDQIASIPVSSLNSLRSNLGLLDSLSVSNSQVPVSVNLLVSGNFDFGSSLLSSVSSSSNHSVNREIIKSSAKPMEGNKKVARSVSDECSQSVTRNDIEKQVTKSIRVDGRYKNPWNTWSDNSFRISSLMRFATSRDNSGVVSQKELDKVLPIEKPIWQEESPENGVRITWIGHSTLVAQFDGFTVLTDPIFSARASPSQYFGPKRYRDPACTIADLPKTLNAVVISHNHYDHLDVNSVTDLHKKYGNSLSWYIPMGLKSWFESIGIKHVIEMDWWEEKCYNGSITIAFTPTQHWTKRTLLDDFTTLWGSWTFIGPTQRFFFTGDSGYCPAFKEIGAIYGPFTAAAIPIGAYEPRWFMKAQHVDPEEAVLIHQDLKARSSVAIHWGTFALAYEFFLEPPQKLKSTMERLNLTNSEFITLKHGQSKIFM